MATTEAGSVMDPHGKKRAKNISKVATGEEPARPGGDGEHPIVSKPPPPSSTNSPNNPKKVGLMEKNGDGKDGQFFSNQLRNCCIRYYEFYRCTIEKGGDEAKCRKYLEAYQILCPSELVKKWDEEKELGLFPQPI